MAPGCAYAETGGIPFSECTRAAPAPPPAITPSAAEISSLTPRCTTISTSAPGSVASPSSSSSFPRGREQNRDAARTDIRPCAHIGDWNRDSLACKYFHALIAVTRNALAVRSLPDRCTRLFREVNLSELSPDITQHFLRTLVLRSRLQVVAWRCKLGLCANLQSCPVVSGGVLWCATRRPSSACGTSPSVPARPGVRPHSAPSD